MKRTFDIVFSLLCLILFAPLAAVIAVLIRLETPGPILTSRTCVGRHGKPFTLYHFRTMTFATPSKASARTPLGRMLCNYTLNDYPTLWSVFIGTMSVVGPRPERPDGVDLAEPLWQQVLTVKPGLIGPALLTLQERYNTTDLQTRTAIDFEYVQHHSLTYDLNLLIRALMRVAQVGHIKDRA